MKKKILFFVMAVFASALFIPNVYADGTVAKIGDTEYETLQAAVDAAKSNETITLVADTKEDIVIAADQEITIDLGTFTLTNNMSHTIVNNGKLTITGKGSVDNVTHQKAALYNEATGSVTINGGKFLRSAEAGAGKKDNGGNSFYTILNHGEIEINDATVENNGKYSSLFENGWYDGNQNTSKKDSKLVINGGTYTGGLNTIKNDDYGVVEINDGLFEGALQASILNVNEATINGGEFHAGEAVILNGKINDTMDKGQLTINGGTFVTEENIPVVLEAKIGGVTSVGTVEVTDGEFNVAMDKVVSKVHTDAGTVSIVAGTFVGEPNEDDLQEGYKVFDNEDGTYTVAKAISLTISAEGYEETVVLPKGSSLTEEEVKLLEETLAELLEGEEFTFGGFYLDKDFTEKFDFTKAMDEDLTVYIKLDNVKEREDDTVVEDKTNPDTSDLNIAGLVITALIASLGLGYVIKNRKFN